ncbi:hypothetical protein JKP88DRAFT_254417 [Tribonema minus]|uniref:Uncharacterized protein n=1 Tax=Tribonema minus TaxID=303371 RepID=A0A835ZCZ9_9STRA|nr:hypothetical protein JKP88DRAFT_254417 [Tribonema minus]
MAVRCGRHQQENSSELMVQQFIRSMVIVGIPAAASTAAPPSNGRKLGVTQTSTTVWFRVHTLTAQHCHTTPSMVRKSEEQIQVHERLLERAGYDGHFAAHVRDVHTHKGSEAMRLGVVSGMWYKHICDSRVFDEFYYPVKQDLRLPLKERRSSFNINFNSATTAAGTAANSDSAPAAASLQDAADAVNIAAARSTLDSDGGERVSGPDYDMYRIVEEKKAPTFGPPGLAPPITNIPHSEGQEKFFHYKGEWKDGKMCGYGVYRFADGKTYQLNYPSQASYLGDFFAGHMHGRGTYTSCPRAFVKSKPYVAAGALQGGTGGAGGISASGDEELHRCSQSMCTVYEGRWEAHACTSAQSVCKCSLCSSALLLLCRRIHICQNGCICGRGSLYWPSVEPKGEVVWHRDKRNWPKTGRYGSGLSVRAALELVRDDAQAQHMRKLQDRDFISGAATMAQLDLYVSKVRREIGQQRMLEKHTQREMRIRARREAKDNMLKAKMAAALQAVDADELQDDGNGSLPSMSAKTL